jgi:hypothetical protein
MILVGNFVKWRSIMKPFHPHVRWSCALAAGLVMYFSNVTLVGQQGYWCAQPTPISNICTTCLQLGGAGGNWFACDISPTDASRCMTSNFQSYCYPYTIGCSGLEAEHATQMDCQMGMNIISVVDCTRTYGTTFYGPSTDPCTDPDL